MGELFVSEGILRRLGEPPSPERVENSGHHESDGGELEEAEKGNN
jgi:hypothetical protein